jgi:hypothetical protein
MKAKIMLSLIAIFAIAGGAAAFKIKRSSIIYCTTTTTTFGKTYAGWTITIGTGIASYCTLNAASLAKKVTITQSP